MAGQRDATRLIGQRGAHGRSGADQERITCCTRQIERRGERPDGLDLGPPPVLALQRAHGMHRQARDRRQLLLREARASRSL